jgi:hypothetical protein
MTSSGLKPDLPTCSIALPRAPGEDSNILNVPVCAVLRYVEAGSNFRVDSPIALPDKRSGDGVATAHGVTCREK